MLNYWSFKVSIDNFSNLSNKFRISTALKKLLKTVTERSIDYQKFLKSAVLIIKNVTERSIDQLGNTVYKFSIIRNLGVIFDPAVIIMDHILGVCRISLFQLRNLLSVRRCIFVQSASQLVHVFMTWQLDYSSSIIVTVFFTILPLFSLHWLP